MGNDIGNAMVFGLFMRLLLPARAGNAGKDVSLYDPMLRSALTDRTIIFLLAQSQRIIAHSFDKADIFPA